VKNIVIFASGSGSNAEKIVEHFKHSTAVKITHIFCNNPEAGVIERAKRLEIPCSIFSREEFKNGTLLRKIQSFPQHIINLHPALLPKFGGKGMFGHFVHEAVVAAGEKESGITIHYVNDQYDEGAIIFQSSFPVLPSDSPEDVAKKGQVLEHRDFPMVIEKLVN